MAGIYIHIPFCKQACHYCDFHFSTILKQKDEFLGALCEEILLRSSELGNRSINTVYFGGGTPSLLNSKELGLILFVLYEAFAVAEDVELCIEMNPDDVEPSFLKELRELGFNRISLGVQSFHAPSLQELNRAHNAQESSMAIQLIREAGITNFSCDLIYGLPNSSIESLKADIDALLAREVPHISIYGLTIEKGTVFGKRLEEGKLNIPQEEAQAEQFELIMNSLLVAGYEQYEISSFCKPNHRSKHNSAYWNNIDFLGFGPSAHSMLDKQRSWNVSNNSKYISQLKKNLLEREVENLTDEERFSEFVLTKIRLIEGIDLTECRDRFGAKKVAQLNNNKSNLSNAYFTEDEKSIRLNKSGRSLADFITLKLID